jgi:NAD dependent epimerase/dehydratase family enzyme
MVSRHAVVAGSSGFIGSAVVTQLRAEGWRVTTLVRRDPANSDEVQWNPATGALDPAVLSGADAVINLSGSSISRMPWTPAIKVDLMESRRSTTQTIVAAIIFLKIFIKGWVGKKFGIRLRSNSYFSKDAHEVDKNTYLEPKTTGRIHK